METIDIVIETACQLSDMHFGLNSIAYRILLERFDLCERIILLSEGRYASIDLMTKSSLELNEMIANLTSAIFEKKRRNLTGLQFAKEAEKELKDKMKMWKDKVKEYKSKNEDDSKIEQAESRVKQIEELLKANKERQKIEKERESR